MLNRIPEAAYPTKILSDGQAILVKDDEYTLLGGEEIILESL